MRHFSKTDFSEGTHFWKVKETCYSHLREYKKAAFCQEALLTNIETHPWTCLDFEYDLAKHTSILAQLLRLSNDEAGFHHVSQRFEGLVFRSPRAEQERTFFHFPASIALAIQLGTSEEARLSINSFLDILEAKRASFTPTYITENLYCCLYGAIALQESSLRVKVLHQFRDFGKPDFKLKFYPMFRFLEVIHMIESRELEDAFRLIKNLRKSNGLEELQGMREVLVFLSDHLLIWSRKAPNVALKLDSISFDHLERIIHGTDLVDYFDLPAWFEAMRQGCSMMEILHHRAITKPMSEINANQSE